MVCLIYRYRFRYPSCNVGKLVVPTYKKNIGIVFDTYVYDCVVVF